MPFPVASPALNPQAQVSKATREAIRYDHEATTWAVVAEQCKEHLETTRFCCPLLERYDYPSQRPIH